MAVKDLLLFTLIITITSLARADIEYLYYTAPGGAPYGELAGLYGTEANWRRKGDALDYPDSGYQCVEDKDELKRGMSMRSLSLDPRTRKVLMNVWKDDHTISLLSGDVCQMQDTCENATVKPQWIFNKAQTEHKAGPYAYYDSKIYFIFLHEEDAGVGRKQTIELRVFTGCEEKYPVHDWTAFYINDCSTLIAELAVVNFEVVSPLKVSDTLFVTNSGGELKFLLLFQRGIYSEQGVAVGFKMELILVKSSSKEVTTLHVEDLDVKFLRYSTFHLGAISMRDDKLCWSSVDRILCTDWSSSGSIGKVETILSKGQAALACLNAGQALTAEITTGIAIANTDKEMAIFFGCIAQRSGYGGAGLVVSHEGESFVYPLLVNNTEILAGNMFLVSHCKPEKIDREVGDGYQYVLPSGSVSVFSEVTLGLFVVLLFAHILQQ